MIVCSSCLNRLWQAPWCSLFQYNFFPLSLGLRLSYCGESSSEHLVGTSVVVQTGNWLFHPWAGVGCSFHPILGGWWAISFFKKLSLLSVLKLQMILFEKGLLTTLKIKNLHTWPRVLGDNHSRERRSSSLSSMQKSLYSLFDSRHQSLPLSLTTPCPGVFSLWLT